LLKYIVPIDSKSCFDDYNISGDSYFKGEGGQVSSYGSTLYSGYLN